MTQENRLLEWMPLKDRSGKLAGPQAFVGRRNGFTMGWHGNCSRVLGKVQHEGRFLGFAKRHPIGSEVILLEVRE